MGQWYFGENGHQSGPVSESELGQIIASGRIGPATLMWREGLPGWMKFDELRARGELTQISAAPYMGYHLQNPPTSGLAISSLVCGIVALVTCLVFVGIPAVICGHMALNQIANSPTLMVGRGMALAGLVCGYLSSLIFLSFVGLIIFGIANSP
jgi:Domain of unknown function (DUF4190)/GYF domain 2